MTQPGGYIDLEALDSETDEADKAPVGEQEFVGAATGLDPGDMGDILDREAADPVAPQPRGTPEGRAAQAAAQGMLETPEKSFLEGLWSMSPLAGFGKGGAAATEPQVSEDQRSAMDRLSNPANYRNPNMPDSFDDAQYKADIQAAEALEFQQTGQPGAVPIRNSTGQLMQSGVKFRQHPIHPNMKQPYVETMLAQPPINQMDIASIVAWSRLSGRYKEVGPVETEGELQDKDIGIMFDTEVPERVDKAMTTRGGDLSMAMDSLDASDFDDFALGQIEKKISAEKWQFARRAAALSRGNAPTGFTPIHTEPLVDQGIPGWRFLDPTRRREIKQLRDTVRQLSNMESMLQYARAVGVDSLDAARGPSALMYALSLDDHPGQRDTQFRIGPKGTAQFWESKYADPLKGLPVGEIWDKVDGATGMMRELFEQGLELYESFPQLFRTAGGTPGWAWKNEGREKLLEIVQAAGFDPGKQLYLMDTLLRKQGVEVKSIPIPHSVPLAGGGSLRIQHPDRPDTGRLDLSSSRDRELQELQRADMPTTAGGLLVRAPSDEDVLAGKALPAPFLKEGPALGGAYREVGADVGAPPPIGANSRWWIKRWAAMDDDERQETMGPELYTAWSEAVEQLPKAVTDTSALLQDSLTWDAPAQVVGIQTLGADQTGAMWTHIGKEFEDYGPVGYFIMNPIDFLLAVSAGGHLLKAPLGVSKVLGMGWRAGGAGVGGEYLGLAGRKVYDAIVKSSRNYVLEAKILGKEAAMATYESLSMAEKVAEKVFWGPLRKVWGHEAPRPGPMSVLPKAEPPYTPRMGPAEVVKPKKTLSGPAAEIERLADRGRGIPIPKEGPAVESIGRIKDGAVERVTTYGRQAGFERVPRLTADQIKFTAEGARDYVRSQNLAAYHSMAKTATTAMAYADPFMVVFGGMGLTLKKGLMPSVKWAAERGGAAGISGTTWGTMNRHLRNYLLTPRERMKSVGLAPGGNELGWATADGRTFDTLYDLAVELESKRAGDIQKLAATMEETQGLAPDAARRAALDQILLDEHATMTPYIRVPTTHSGGPGGARIRQSQAEVAAEEAARDATVQSMEIRAALNAEEDLLRAGEATDTAAHAEEVASRTRPPKEAPSRTGERPGKPGEEPFQPREERPDAAPFSPETRAEEIRELGDVLAGLDKMLDETAYAKSADAIRSREFLTKMRERTAKKLESAQRNAVKDPVAREAPTVIREDTGYSVFGPSYYDVLTEARKVQRKKLRRKKDKHTRYGQRRREAAISEDTRLERGEGEWGVEWSEFSRPGRPKTKKKHFGSQAERDDFAKTLEKNDNFDEIVSRSGPQPEPNPDWNDLISETLEDVLPNPRVEVYMTRGEGIGWEGAQSRVSKFDDAWKEIKKNGSDHDIVTFLSQHFEYSHSLMEELGKWSEKLRMKRDAQSIRAHKLKGRMRKGRARVKKAEFSASKQARSYEDRNNVLREVLALKRFGGSELRGKGVMEAVLGAQEGAALDAYIAGNTKAAEKMLKAIDMKLVDLIDPKILRPRLLRYSTDRSAAKPSTTIFTGDPVVNEAFNQARAAGFVALDARRKALIMRQTYEKLKRKIDNIAKDPFRGLQEARSGLKHLKEYMPTKTEAYFESLAAEVKELTPLFATGDGLFQRSKGTLNREFVKWADSELSSITDTTKLAGRIKADLDALKRLYQDPTAGRKTVKQMAEMYRSGKPITWVPFSHLSLAKVLAELRKMRRLGQKAEEIGKRNIFKDMTYNYSPSGKGDQMIIRAEDILDTFARRKTDQRYLDFLDAKFNLGNVTDVDIVYSPRLPGGGEATILQLTPEAEAATAMRKLYTYAGRESVNVGNLSELSYWTNVDTYATGFYRQYEKLFDLGGGDVIALQEFKEAIRRGAKTGFYTDRMKRPIIKYAMEFMDQKQFGRINNPHYYFGVGMDQIFHNIHHRHKVKALSSAMMTDGMPLSVPRKIMGPEGALIDNPNLIYSGGKYTHQGKDLGAMGYIKTGEGGKHKAWFELENSFVHPDAYHYINGARGIEGPQSWWIYKKYSNMIGRWKMWQTVYFPPTHAHNIFANIWASTINGTNPLVSQSARQADVWSLVPQYWKRQGPGIDEAIRADLFGATFVDQEASTMVNRVYQEVAKDSLKFFDEPRAIRDPMYQGMAFLEESMKLGTAMRRVGAKLRGGSRNLSQTMRKLYRFEDEIFRLWRFNQVRILQKEFAKTGKITRDMKRVIGEDTGELMKVLDHADVNSGAALEVAKMEAGKWYFDYTDVPGWVNAYRKFGKMFFTFQYKAVPRLLKWMHEHPVQGMYWSRMFDTMNFLDEHMNGDMDYTVKRDQVGIMNLASKYSRTGGKVAAKMEEIRYMTMDKRTGERVERTAWVPAAQADLYWTAVSNLMPRNEKLQHNFLDWAVDNPVLKGLAIMAGRNRTDPWATGSRAKPVWDEKDGFDIAAQKVAQEWGRMGAPALFPGILPSKILSDDGIVEDYVNWADRNSTMGYLMNFIPGVRGGRVMEDLRLSLDGTPKWVDKKSPYVRNHINTFSQILDKGIKGTKVFPIDITHNSVTRLKKSYIASINKEYDGALGDIMRTAPGGENNPEYKRLAAEKKEKLREFMSDLEQRLRHVSNEGQKHVRAIYAPPIEQEAAGMQEWIENYNKNPVFRSIMKAIEDQHMRYIERKRSE